MAEIKALFWDVGGVLVTNAWDHSQRKLALLALDVTQQVAERCCFIDDRALNLEVAKRLGIHTIEMDEAARSGGT